MEGILLKLWGKVCLSLTITLGVIAFGLNCSLGTSRSTYTISAQAATTINAEEQGMIGDSITANNSALQSILEKYHDKELTIYIPSGVYKFKTGNFKLHSNITFKFEKNAIFRVSSGNLVNFIYPSPKAGYNGGIKNIRWEGATFQGDNTSSGQSIFNQSIHHATNVTFNNCYFYNAELPFGHYLDIDGSHNINITNSTFTGFNGSEDFKEAIQIDYSNPSAMSYRNPGDHYDNLPTYNVRVIQNKFLPIYNNSGKIVSYAPNPIGEHTVYYNRKLKTIHDIHFTNNTVIDPKPLMKSDYATIRFIDVSNLWITNNNFVNQRVLNSGNYIYLQSTSPIYKSSNLTVKNNTFKNINPNKQYIFLNASNAKSSLAKVTITGNKITGQKDSVPFVKGNFSFKSKTIRVKNNKTVLSSKHTKYFSELSHQNMLFIE